MAGKENKKYKNSVFVDLFYEDESAEANDVELEECIEKGILADYFRKKGSEVINMLTAEYDYNLDIEVQREEAREEGREQGEEFKLITQIIKKLKKGNSGRPGGKS